MMARIVAESYDWGRRKDASDEAWRLHHAQGDAAAFKNQARELEERAKRLRALASRTRE